jgi:hypothetical protein
MILDVHAHVGKPNYAYRAAEFTRADLVSRMLATIRQRVHRLTSPTSSSAAVSRMSADRSGPCRCSGHGLPYVLPVA